jgi:hypothetical protein
LGHGRIHQPGEGDESGWSDAPEVVCQRYACDKPQTAVTFKVDATTIWGENLYLAGNSPLLSNWVPGSAVKLSPADYPTWSVTLSLPASTTFEYKFVKRDGSGTIVWEGGDNRTFTTPASGAVPSMTPFVDGGNADQRSRRGDRGDLLGAPANQLQCVTCLREEQEVPPATERATLSLDRVLRQ